MYVGRISVPSATREGKPVLNIAAIFNLYKSTNPPVYKDHVAEIMQRVEQELKAAEELQAATKSGIVTAARRSAPPRS